MSLFNSSSANQTTEQQQIAVQGGSGDGSTPIIGGGAIQAQQAQEGGAAVGFSNGTVVGSGTSLTQDNIFGTVTISDTPQVVGEALDAASAAFAGANQTAEQSVNLLQEDTTAALTDLQSAQAQNTSLTGQIASAIAPGAIQTALAAQQVSAQGQLISDNGFNLSTTETILAALAALLAILFYLHKK